MHFTLAVGAAMATLALPGLGLVRSMRLPAVTSMVFAAPVSIVVLVLSAYLSRILGVPWSPASPLVLGLGAWGVAELIRHVVRPPALDSSHRGRTASVALVTGVVAGALVLALRVHATMGSWSDVNQTYDNVFHLNAVRHILARRDGSMASVGDLATPPDVSSYYPSAWHTTASLVTMLSGGDVVLASNALMVVVACIVWPLSIVGLLHLVTDVGAVGLFAGGVLSAISTAFPIAVMSFGVLLPYLLAMSILPLALAALGLILRRLAGDPGIPWVRMAILGGLTLVAIGSAHPQGVMGIVVLGLPLMIWASIEASRVQIAARRILPGPSVIVALTCVTTVVSAYVFVTFRPSFGSSIWRADTDLPTAAARVATLVADAAEPWWPMATIALACAVATLTTRRDGWIVASWTWAGLLAILAMGEHDEALRYVWTGPWYSDTQRIAALPAIIAVPMLAVGIDAIARALQRRSPVPESPLAPVALASAVVAVLALGALSPSAASSEQAYAAWWKDNGLLSPDERTVIEQIPDLVPEGEVIATNPWNGGSLAYAMADRRVTAPFMTGYRSEGHAGPLGTHRQHSGGPDGLRCGGNRERPLRPRLRSDEPLGTGR